MTNEIIQAEVVKKRKYRVAPTIRQIKAIRYINEGLSKRQAFIKAGYSDGYASSNIKNKLKKGSFVKVIMSMQNELQEAGLTSQYMVGKFREWMEATKAHPSGADSDRKVPDYDVQLKAYKEWKNVMQPTEPKEGKVKRTMTVTEFITGENEIPE